MNTVFLGENPCSMIVFINACLPHKSSNLLCIGFWHSLTSSPSEHYSYRGKLCSRFCQSQTSFLKVSSIGSHAEFWNFQVKSGGSIRSDLISLYLPIKTLILELWYLWGSEPSYRWSLCVHQEETRGSPLDVREKGQIVSKFTWINIKVVEIRLLRVGSDQVSLFNWWEANSAFDCKFNSYKEISVRISVRKLRLFVTHKNDRCIRRALVYDSICVITPMNLKSDHLVSHITITSKSTRCMNFFST